MSLKYSIYAHKYLLSVWTVTGTWKIARKQNRQRILYPSTACVPGVFNELHTGIIEGTVKHSAGWLLPQEMLV